MTSGGPRPLPLAAAKPSLDEAASGPLAPSPLAGRPPGTLATPSLSGCVLPDAGPGVRALPGGPAPGPPPPGLPGSRPSRPPAVKALLLPGPCTPRRKPACCQSAAPPEPCTPWQPPGGPERPCTAHRRRLRLQTAASSRQASGAACRGSGRVARAAVPSAREPRSRLFSVEKTGNFARLRQAEQDTSRLTDRRHPLRRSKWE